MKRLLLIILFLLPISTYAVTMPAKIWYNVEAQTVYNPNSIYKFFTTQQGACDYNFPRLYPTGLYGLVSATVSNSVCYLSIKNLSNGNVGYNSTGIVIAYQCESGWTLNNGVCSSPTCPTGMTANASGVCVDNCLPNKGQTGSFPLNCSAESFSGSGVCMPNNCAATVVDSSSTKVSGCWYGYNTARYTGATCSGQPGVASFSNPSNANPPPDDDPRTKCLKAGQSFGVVNGVTVCVPKSSSGAAPVTSGTQTNTTTTNTDANGNSNTQNSSEVKSVSQDGDQVTSQIIKNNPDGTKTESTITQPVSEFCATNPNHSICKKANEDTPSSCEDNPDLPQCLQLGDADDNETIATTTHTVSFTPVSITSGGGCPADKSVSIAGRSITFSYSWLCQYASMFRPFMLAFAYLSAAMFMFWGYKGAQT